MKGLRLGAGWESPATMRHRWLAGIFAVSALFALLVALTSANPVHRLWGTMAACGYGVALLTLTGVRHGRSADLAIGLSFCGALAAPLTLMAIRGIRQPEVMVVVRSGQTLIHQGTPYASAAALSGTPNPNAYNPYLPVMAVFGLPRALFGGGLLTDPRIYFALVFLAIFWLALRRGGARDPVRWTILVAGSPVIAQELAVGGTDVPMVAALCLGFAYLWQDRPVLAGLALGVGASMKATAWPALLVAAVLLSVRGGKRATGVFTVAALGVFVACVGPFVAGHPKALADNTVLFPLGLASVKSAATSPLPGHLIASTGQAGHTIVILLLALAGLAVALSLVSRPPRTVPQAVVLLAGALTLMFLLAPSTRFGYFIYPATLLIWMHAARAGGAIAGDSATPDPDDRLASARTS